MESLRRLCRAMGAKQPHERKNPAFWFLRSNMKEISEIMCCGIFFFFFFFSNFGPLKPRSNKAGHTQVKTASGRVPAGTKGEGLEPECVQGRRHVSATRGKMITGINDQWCRIPFFIDQVPQQAQHVSARMSSTQEYPQN